MLLLVTLVLVVASAVLLVLGFVQDALGFIYLSMLCAGVAALALFVFARLARRRSAVVAAAGIAPTARDAERREQTEVARRGPASREGRDEDVTARQAAVATGEIPLEEPLAQVDDRAGLPEDSSDDWEDWGEEVVFPIEGYDDLRVSEILPLLSRLGPDELQEVRDRELAGKGRATVLDRIDDRLGRGSRAARSSSAGGRQQRARGGQAPVGGPGDDRIATSRPRARKATKADGSTAARPPTPGDAPAGSKAAPAKRASRRATATSRVTAGEGDDSGQDRAAPAETTPDQAAAEQTAGDRLGGKAPAQAAKKAPVRRATRRPPASKADEPEPGQD